MAGIEKDDKKRTIGAEPKDPTGTKEAQEMPPEELPAGPVDRGGSLQPHDLDEEVDEASDESFPASDSPSFTPVQGTGCDDKAAGGR